MASTSDTIFKQTEKKYKLNKRDPDAMCWDEVFDFHNNKHPECCINPDDVLDLELPLSARSPSVFAVPDLPGFYFIRCPFSPTEQQACVRNCLCEYPKVPPHITNLSKLGQQPAPPSNSEDQSVLWTPPLRWITLGYHHNWETRVYDENCKSEIPASMKSLGEHLFHCLHNILRSLNTKQKKDTAIQQPCQATNKEQLGQTHTGQGHIRLARDLKSPDGCLDTGKSVDETEIVKSTQGPQDGDCPQLCNAHTGQGHIRLARDLQSPGDCLDMGKSVEQLGETKLVKSIQGPQDADCLQDTGECPERLDETEHTAVQRPCGGANKEQLCQTQTGQEVDEVSGEQTAAFPSMVVEAAIVNFYKHDNTICGHIDDSEFTFEKPIVSISFGCSAILLVGGKTKDTKPHAFKVCSGDVVVLGGASRLAYHAVPRVFKGTCPAFLQRGAVLEEKMMEDRRINISLRQVNKDQPDGRTSMNP